MTATNQFVTLRFANHDATLYGVNLEGNLALWDNMAYGRGEFRGALNYVRGQRTDGTNLYHMMPLNGRLAFDHKLGGWNSSIELQLVGAKDDVSQVRNETTTAAYALVNLRTGYQWDNVYQFKQIRVDVGVDNLLNTNYELPLGGAYGAIGMNSAANTGGTVGGVGGNIWGLNVLGPGRSINARLAVAF